MGKYYKVQPGDCLSRIAHGNGLTWQVLWDDPENSALREKRKNPNILYPGDIVYIPDLRPNHQDSSSELRHRFRLKHAPAKMKIQLVERDWGQAIVPPPNGDALYEDPDFQPVAGTSTPRANLPFTLAVVGKLMSGQTDSDGFLECYIPPDAQEGRLTLNPGAANEEAITLQIGGMDPMSEVPGQKKRLSNLGFHCDAGDDATPEFQAALSLFQEFAGCQITGDADDATQSALQHRHGS